MKFFTFGTSLNKLNHPNEKAWKLEEKCTKSIDDLFSIVLIYESFTFEIIEHIRYEYPNVQIVLGYDGMPSIQQKLLSDKKLTFLKLNNKSESEKWRLLVEKVNTNYVFMGYKIQKFRKKFSNFERMIRLLDGTNAAVVSGATKNITGRVSKGRLLKRSTLKIDLPFLNIQSNHIFKNGFLWCSI